MQTWEKARGEYNLTGTGNPALLDLPMTAFFSSRQCPGAAIRAAMDWALQQAKLKTVVISGFHSPLEQSVLKVLIQARSPVVVVLARPVDSAKLPREWIEPLALGRMAVVCIVQTGRRLSAEVASARNRLVVQLAGCVVAAHASPNGALANLLVQCTLEARDVHVLAGEA